MNCPHSTLVRDATVDDVICELCGLVLQNDQIPGEWVAPTSSMKDTETLPPSVSRGISKICSEMRLCDMVREEAFRLARCIQMKRRHEPSLAACVYLACKNLRLCRMQHEFEAALHIPRKALGRAISRQLRAGLAGDLSGQDDMGRMLPRIVSAFTRQYPSQICQRKLESVMLATYRDHWGRMRDHRDISMNSALAKCMFEAVQSIEGDRLHEETKALVKRICGVKTI